MNKKIKTIIIVILVLVIAVFAGVKAVNMVQINKVKAEYIKAIDANIETYLAMDAPEATKAGLSDIRYEIQEIYKYRGIYTPIVTFYLTAENPTSSLLTTEVKRECIAIGKNMDASFYLAGKECCYRPLNHKVYGPQTLVWVSVNDGQASGPRTIDEMEASLEGVKCPVCGTRYKEGSDNARSIKRTNMCSSCYSGYQNIQDALN